MARYATIDVGSNSILLHIAERDEQGRWQPVLDKVEITRLGEGLQASGSLKPKAIERTVHTLKDFVRLTREQNVADVAAVGTMCLRTAQNANEFLQKAKDECGVVVDVIPGEEEARLSYLAVKSGIGLPEGRVVIFDVGGGSTELILGKGNDIERTFSLNIGATGLTEKYLTSNPVTADELNNMLNDILNAFADVNPSEKMDVLVGIGGTMTTIGAVMHKLAVYDPNVIHGISVPRAEIERQMELCRSKTIGARKTIVGLQPKRADVILAGIGIVYTILKKLGADSVTISDRGVRHGLMVDRFGQ